jgi:hypothetical protein
MPDSAIGRSMNDLTEKIDVVNAGVVHVGDTQERERQGEVEAETTLLSSEFSIEKERMQIIDWLSPINFFLRHADISRGRQKDTGGWLLEDSRFKRWESGSERTLWCRGIRALFNPCVGGDY